MIEDVFDLVEQSLSGLADGTQILLAVRIGVVLHQDGGNACHRVDRSTQFVRDIREKFFGAVVGLLKSVDLQHEAVNGLPAVVEDHQADDAGQKDHGKMQNQPSDAQAGELGPGLGYEQEIEEGRCIVNRHTGEDDPLVGSQGVQAYDNDHHRSQIVEAGVVDTIKEEHEQLQQGIYVQPDIAIVELRHVKIPAEDQLK